jgi:zinc transporter
VRFWTESYLAEVVEQDKRTAALEDRSFADDVRGEVDALHDLRRSATLLRRRVAAHRAAVASVGGLVGTELVESHEHRWRELARQSEETADVLDGVIERLHSLDDHVQKNLSTMLGDRLYILTLISVIILPLSLVTGLLGVNVAGIPLRDSRWAFPLLCLVLIGLAMFQYWVAKRLRWLPRQDPRLRIR